jgi:hypothetical protein
MSSKTKTPTFDNREPISLFELERRQRHLEPGAGTISDDFPKLPASSPWHSDPVGKEPAVDRREDGDTTGVPIDQHDGGEDA